MTFTVYGEPAPQGSKRAFRNRKTGASIMVESSRLVKPWRTAVEQAVMLAAPFGGRADAILIRGPVEIDITFTLPRPKSAKRGAVPAGRPDIDKLCRATFDALKTAGVYEDDGRIVCAVAIKTYPDQCEDALSAPGALIRIVSAA